jgi:hypothetical protein
MDSDIEKTGEDWEPKVKKSDTDQKARKNQTGDSQNSTGGREIVVYETPSKATNPR